MAKNRKPGGLIRLSDLTEQDRREVMALFLFKKKLAESEDRNNTKQ